MAPHTESFSRQQSGIAIKLPGSQHRSCNLRVSERTFHKLRTRFEEFEAEGKKLSECDHYCQEVRRVRQRNRLYDEPCSAPELPANKFRTDTFLVIIDNVDAELVKRLEAYTCIAEGLGF